MLISASNSLRISLFGGSTDHPSFIKKYKKSKIISFSSNLKTHVIIHRDKFGMHTSKKIYLIRYNKFEKIKKIRDINNILIKTVLDHFSMPAITVGFYSDIDSYGNGLASSSSFILGLIDCCLTFHKKKMSIYSKAKLALKLERNFNKNCGYQDPFGCAFDGFNILKTSNDKNYRIQKLELDLFKKYDFFLLPTGLNRNSKNILNKLSKNTSKILPLYDLAIKAEKSLIQRDYKKFLFLLRSSWEHKKNTSLSILSNKKLKNLDNFIYNEKKIIAHKLLGAGGGGFFLCIFKKGNLLSKIKMKKFIECKPDE